MGLSCTRRHFVLSTCFLQMIAIIERQVFDFLGYMWAPICVNFFHIIFIILGFYGAYHFRIKYIITYLIWNLLWIGWNTFLICFYLEIGSLSKDSDLLNLGTGSMSWFEENGYGCKAIYSTNFTNINEFDNTNDPYRPLRPEHVIDCLLPYEFIEIIHSGLQCFLACGGILGALLISYIFIDEDDRLNYGNKRSKHHQSLYSIEFGPNLDSIRHRNRTDTVLDYDQGRDNYRYGSNFDRGLATEAEDGCELSPKPMTPRRVKRRSVMARGTNNRQSTTSRRNQISSNGNSNSGGSGSGGMNSAGTNATKSVRKSLRNSRRKYQQNPVTKILDQQQNHHQQKQSHHTSSQLKQQQQQKHRSHHNQTHPFASFQSTSLQKNNSIGSNLEMLPSPPLPPPPLPAVQPPSNNINAVSSSSLTGHQHHHNHGYDHYKLKSNVYHSFRKNIPPDPIYYNTNAQLASIEQQQSGTTVWPATMETLNVKELQKSDAPHRQHHYPHEHSPSINGDGRGHYNPTYQHSTSNLNNHLIECNIDNRPPSVRSSYSNFHGARTINSASAASLSNINQSVASSSLITQNMENFFVGLMSSTTTALATTTASSPATTVTSSTGNFLNQLNTLEHVPPATPPLYQQHHQSLHDTTLLSLPLPLPATSSQSTMTAAVTDTTTSTTLLLVPTTSLPAEPQYVSGQYQKQQEHFSFDRRTASRESIRSMAFLNNGPPAYNLNYHTPPDSETTM